MKNKVKDNTIKRNCMNKGRETGSIEGYTQGIREAGC